MRIKYINRNLKFDEKQRQIKSSYKCNYEDKNLFDKLQINISYNSQNRTFEIESRFLKSTSKSIHFQAVKKGNSFDIIWQPIEIVPYIHRIK